jgi:hypothetical protein
MYIQPEKKLGKHIHQFAMLLQEELQCRFHLIWQPSNPHIQ